jgi:2,3-bisphosphoglycerate-independent phosphoglycerate mutase
MRILFIFLDGVGLGNDDPAGNPFASAEMPSLNGLLGGRSLVMEAFSPTADQAFQGGLLLEGERASLLALDAGLGVPGLPQSATGQAVLLTGINIPAALGYHYGPKPNQAIADHLKNGNLFNTLHQNCRRAALLNAYPPGYFKSIETGRRLFSAIPLAVTSAGLLLMTTGDLQAGRALSADFTGQGWRERLGLPDTPIISEYQAGERLARLSQDYDLAFFEYWLSDYAGHHQDMPAALELLGTFDQVLAGLVDSWDDSGLILVTSDHGNLEDLTTRRHTANPVPALLIGPLHLRRSFSEGLTDLTGITPAILKFLGVSI